MKKYIVPAMNMEMLSAEDVIATSALRVMDGDAEASVKKTVGADFWN